MQAEAGCGTHGGSAEKKNGNPQPHLSNIEHNHPSHNTSLLSRGDYRPPGSSPPRNTEVTRSAHLKTYGLVFFVLCSLCFVVVLRLLFSCASC